MRGGFLKAEVQVASYAAHFAAKNGAGEEGGSLGTTQFLFLLLGGSPRNEGKAMHI